MKWTKRLSIFFLIVYITFCIALYFFQSRLIFNPEVLPQSHNYGAGEEVEIPLTDELSMNGVMIKTPNSKGAILYFHGNRNCIRFALYQIRQMVDNGYDILIPDYRGYGKTEGFIDSEQTFYGDAQKAYEYLKKNYQEEQIVVIGYSLGSAAATYVAAQNHPKHLALVAPFTSLENVKNDFLWFVPDFLLHYKFPSERYLKEVSCPITIFHGTEDKVVETYHGKEMADIQPNTTDLILVENTNHRRIIFTPSIRQLFKSLQ